MWSQVGTVSKCIMHICDTNLKISNSYLSALFWHLNSLVYISHNSDVCILKRHESFFCLCINIKFPSLIILISKTPKPQFQLSTAEFNTSYISLIFADKYQTFWGWVPKIFLFFLIMNGLQWQSSFRMLHFFIIPHVQTQSNWVCNYHVILLFLMLQRIILFPDFFKMLISYQPFNN
jgi:hypothetical protein